MWGKKRVRWKNNYDNHDKGSQFGIKCQIAHKDSEYEVIVVMVIMINDNSFHVLDIVVKLDQSLEGWLIIFPTGGEWI